MKLVVASGLCSSLATVNVFLAASPAWAQRPFETCLTTAETLFRDGSQSELTAIRACQGTTEAEDLAACLELVDRLWVDGSESELVGFEACQVQRLLFEDELDTLQTGAYLTCLRQAEESTQDQTSRELISIQACNGLTQPEEVAACLRLAESLWHDETEAEFTALSACQVSLY
ncbi:hypothetical protein [Oscillatoria sp. CS-180]|uniref:hypothetical protein n=1 Tax=Oscillatoria sp. CS-180 TaxID=3021720 RepID=UPI00232C731B|nr:hypothetical protein [Oscillatoria sp. CS-180]